MYWIFLSGAQSILPSPTGKTSQLEESSFILTKFLSLPDGRLSVEKKSLSI